MVILKLSISKCSFSNFKFSHLQISSLQFVFLPLLNFQVFQIANCQAPYFRFPVSNSKCPKRQVHRPSNIFRISDSQLWYFPRTPPYFLVFVQKENGDKYWVRGSRFGHIFGRSTNVLKSIAIDQESLISHFGIIKTPRIPGIT